MVRAHKRSAEPRPFIFFLKAGGVRPRSLNRAGRHVAGSPVIFRGPNMNPKVVERLVQIAQELRIPYQLAAAGRATPNDANALQISGGGVATGLVAIPNRYMHSAVETVSMDDLDGAAELLANFAARLADQDDFTPGV